MTSSIRIFVFIIIFNNTLHAMHENKIALAGLVKHAIIPVLYVNDYIVPVSNGYEALYKELFLFINTMDKKLTSFLISQKNDNSDNPIPRYAPMRFDIGHNDYNFLTIQDKEQAEQLPNTINICLGNAACGASMLGILLMLTFCR